MLPLIQPPQQIFAMKQNIEHHIEQLLLVKRKAEKHFCRIPVVLKGDDSWINSLLNRYVSCLDERAIIVKIGGESFDRISALPIGKGKQLLGSECDVLIYDMRSGFDANCFNSAVGTIKGGGALIALQPNSSNLNHWLQRQIEILPTLLSSSKSIANLTMLSELPPSYSDSEDLYGEQTQAVALIKRVLYGHRKRPLVLSADRGRGKSSALGIAAAGLISERACQIIVSAPARSTVEPLFQHCYRLLGDSITHSSRNKLCSQSGSVRYISADELMRDQVECDLLLIDEAAAIPVPMLKNLISRYHRVVLSSTVHGYEGCGRGFSLKFVPWLRDVRAGMKEFLMSQPIRWAKSDPLETWCQNTFLLASELSSVDNISKSHSRAVLFEAFQKEHMSANSDTLSKAFALLVNAHYQTSPNDLMQIIDNPNVTLYVARVDKEIVGSVLVNKEGQLALDIVSNIQLGKRRPKGHLVPSDLANHLGVAQAATQSCARVMRIAVHPKLQNCGFGSAMLSKLENLLKGKVDYLATSFGATKELLLFWDKANYLPLRLGFSVDQASGTHSVIFVRALSNDSRQWVTEGILTATKIFQSQFMVSARKVSPDVANVLFHLISKAKSHCAVDMTPLLKRYADGGNSLETIRPFLVDLMDAGDIEDEHSDLLAAIGLLGWSLPECADYFGIKGKKAVEAKLRREVSDLLVRLQCKSNGISNQAD